MIGRPSPPVAGLERSRRFRPGLPPHDRSNGDAAFVIKPHGHRIAAVRHRPE